MNILSGSQQSGKRAAQRAAVSSPDVSAAMLLYKVLYFFSFLKHRGKLCALRFVKAVIAYTSTRQSAASRGMTCPILLRQWQQVPGSSKIAGAFSAPNV